MKESRIALLGAWIVAIIGFALIIFVWVIPNDIQGLPIPIQKRLFGTLVGIVIISGSIVMHLTARLIKRGEIK